MFEPVLGSTYKFTFGVGYNKFDGVYRLVKIMTYDEYLDDGGNLLADFYTPNGKGEEDLDNDLAKLRVTKIMKLVSPDESDESTKAVYAPWCYVEQTPDHNVNSYTDIGIVVKIGLVKDSKELDYLAENIKEATLAATGIHVEPKFVALTDKWLSDNDFEEIYNARDHAKRKVINYFTECIKLRKQIDSLNTIIQEYERYIVEHSLPDKKDK